MKNDMEQILKQALAPNEEPDFWLNQKILSKSKERKYMKGNKRKSAAGVVLGMAILVLGSTGVYAAYQYLAPDHVAEKIGDSKLAAAFASKDAVQIDETQSFQDYEVTLLGMISGKGLSDFASISNGEIKDNKTYAVTAISRTDGTDMTAEDDQAFFVSPVFQDYNPAKYNIVTMNGGYSEFIYDGILYRLAECDNIEIFAKHTIYLCVSDSTFYNQDAYTYQEKSGKIERNKEYQGVNALFVLPISEAYGDDAAVETYLEDLEASAKASDTSQIETDTAEEEMYQKLTPENLDEYAEPIESTRQVLKPDENGVSEFEYAFEDGRAQTGSIDAEEVFTNANQNYNFSYDVTDTVIWGYSSSGTMDSMLLDVFHKNEDGTVTYVVYKIKADQIQ